MRVDPYQCEPGCILEHKAGGWRSVSGILSRLLRVFDQSYSGWGWHLSIAWAKSTDGWWILEATGEGVELNYYDNLFLFKDTRIYKWLDNPSPERMATFSNVFIGQPYDRAVYFWTGLAVIMWRLFRRVLPRMTDRNLTCWELTAEFAAFMGKPLLHNHEIITISNLVAALSDASSSYNSNTRPESLVDNFRV